MNRPALLVALFFVTVAAAQDTRKTCLIAAELRNPGLAAMEEVLVSVSSGKSLAARHISRGLTHSGGFWLQDVPEGEFRVTNVRYAAPPRTVKDGAKPGLRFDTLGIASAASDRGDIANELSGTCKGGFIWLGSFVIDPGGMTAPTMTLGNNEVTAANARGEVKSQVKGTPWEAEIDKPVANTPLAKGKNVEGKMDAETAAKAVAAVAAQTHNAKAPPSDPGAVEAAVGTWVLTTINDKPVPAPLKSAPTCIFHNASMTVKPDASYASELLMECNDQKFPMPTAGFIGIKGGVVTYAPTKGPPANPLVKNTMAGDTLTSVAAGDTYIYKLKK